MQSDTPDGAPREQRERWARAEKVAIAGVMVSLVIGVLSLMTSRGQKVEVVLPSVVSSDSPAVTSSAPEQSPGSTSTSVESSSTTLPTTTIAVTTTHVLPTPATAKISSKVFSSSFEVGQSVVTRESLVTKHDGKPGFSASPVVVCTYSAGRLTFVSAGKCRIKVTIPATSRYKTALKTFDVNVLERGLTNSQELLLGQADAFDSSLFVHKYRGISNFEAAVGDLIKTWRLKASIVMPSAGEMTGTCRNIYVNFSYRKDFGNYRTTCPSPRGNFDVCVEFWPKGGSSPYPFPSDQAAQVALDNFYVSLQLASSNIQVDQARANPPKLTVNDVRPGACS